MKAILRKWFLLFSGLVFLGNNLRALTFEELGAKATNGDTTAQFEMGRAYHYGLQGVPQNDDEALKWWAKAAFQNNPEAQYWLGMLYYYGKGVGKVDHPEAIKWFRRSAENGFTDAQFCLGKQYVMGIGVAKDFVQAVKWLTKAAEAGNPGAQYSLALRYARAEGVEVDDAKAVYWFRRSSEQGYEGSFLLLAKRYADGEGATKDPVEAYKWMTLAINRTENNKAATRQRGALAKKMTPDQIAEGETRAQTFTAKVEIVPTRASNQRLGSQTEASGIPHVWRWVGGVAVLPVGGIVVYQFMRKRREKTISG